MSKYESRRIWMNTGAQAKLKNLALEETTVRRTQKIYRQAQKDIEAQVEQIYAQLGTLAKNNRWEFSGLKNPATKKTISELTAAIDKAGLSDYVPEKLSNRMSVLQAKEMNIWLKLNQAGEKSHAATKEAMLKSMQNSGAIWQRALEAGAAGFVGFDRNICGYMMGMNWADGNFSSRLWNTTQDTWEKVRDELTKALANGQSPETTKKNIRNMLTQAHNPNARGSGGIDYDVERIIRTETAKASTQADLVRWREAGVTKVQWNASFEKNTCSHCADRDGRVYELKETMLDEPPLHPNCRCYFTAYDEVAAKFDDTTYYKDEQGNYQEIQWAPYHSVIDSNGRLRSDVIPVSNYFWNASPWSVYMPPVTPLKIEGEIDQAVADAVTRTYQAVADQFPEFAEMMEEYYDNKVILHRGKSAFADQGRLRHFNGVTIPKDGIIAINYPDGRKGGNILSQMAEYAKAQFKKRKASTDKDNYVILHEFGHVLNLATVKRGIKNEDFIKAVTGAKTKKRALEIIGTKISTDGTKNPAEAFAELFARMMSQDQSLMNPLTSRFAMVLSESLGRTNKRKIQIK